MITLVQQVFSGENLIEASKPTPLMFSGYNVFPLLNRWGKSIITKIEIFNLPDEMLVSPRFMTKGGGNFAWDFCVTAEELGKIELLIKEEEIELMEIAVLYDSILPEKQKITVSARVRVTKVI